MTTIRATCPHCGEIGLTPAEILLFISTPADSIYGFSCPECVTYVEKPADERTIRLLLSGGVTPQQAPMPAEVRERKEGPPISHDDLLAFHEDLEGSDWFDELTRKTP